MGKRFKSTDPYAQAIISLLMNSTILSLNQSQRFNNIQTKGESEESHFQFESVVGTERESSNCDPKKTSRAPHGVCPTFSIVY